MSTILTAESLKVRYRNGALGIVDVSLEVNAGQVVALFGANGAGKTTTVRAISGFLRSEGAKIVSGKVTLFGEDITNCEPHSATKRGIAFVAAGMNGPSGMEMTKRCRGDVNSALGMQSP